MWANAAITETHHQAAASNTDKPYIVIPARCNQETLVHPNPDSLPSNNTSDETIETINRTLQNSEVVAVQRLKNGDIVITFKKEMTEYKKGDDWVIEVFKARATCACHEIMMLAKGLPNRNITRAHTDLERLFEDLKRKKIPNITRIKLRHI